MRSGRDSVLDLYIFCGDAPHGASPQKTPFGTSPQKKHQKNKLIINLPIRKISIFSKYLKINRKFFNFYRT